MAMVVEILRRVQSSCQNMKSASAQLTNGKCDSLAIIQRVHQHAFIRRRVARCATPLPGPSPYLSREQAVAAAAVVLRCAADPRESFLATDKRNETKTTFDVDVDVLLMLPLGSTLNNNIPSTDEIEVWNAWKNTVLYSRQDAGVP